MPDSNKQIARAFRYARKRINSGNGTYICLALEDAEGCNEIDYATFLQARNIILGRMQLPPHHPIEEWLRINVPEYVEFLNTERDFAKRYEQTKKYRLRWLDALIEEFDNK